MPKSRITFCNADYKFSHGKEPKGRGLWCFTAVFGPGRERTLWFSGSFAEAKQKAKKEISDLNPVACCLRVQP